MSSLQENLTPAGIADLVEKAIPSLAFDLRRDVVHALEFARDTETNESGRAVLEQLLTNARIAADKRVPLCQDTGSVWVLLEIGERDVAGDTIALPTDIFKFVDTAVAHAYEEAKLRNSLVHDALFDRSNTGDNTPAFCEIYLNSHKRGATLHIMLKGGGSDNASKLVMLSPGAGLDGVRDVVLDAIREKGANACPPLIIGVGIGSTFDKVGGLAKRALLRPLCTTTTTSGRIVALEQELLQEINALGIGPGGFGGDTTALSVNILTAPSHIAALPVAVNIGCNSMRSVSIDLDGAL
jgi:tartrate/fumarate subfamily iron-sulfur-dependent hydro-lyase alpha chain